MAFSLAQVENRFVELIADGDKIIAAPQRTGFSDYVNVEQARKWAMNALTIISSTMGNSSDYYTRINGKIDMCALLYEFSILHSYLKAAYDDLKGGYIFSQRAPIEAEVCSDFLDQATELQKAGYKDAAAVIAGGVLEQHMRTMCNSRSITLLKPNGKHKMINDMNDDLVKAAAYNAHKKNKSPPGPTCETTLRTETTQLTPRPMLTPFCGT